MQNAVESSAPGAVPESSSKPASGGPRQAASPQPTPTRPEEIGGPTGPEPTRYGDWERNGRCIDF
jgi:hypothetical protein